MAEPMSVWVDVWPVAADDAGLWLITGDRLITGSPVMSDSDPWDEGKALLARLDITDPGPGRPGGLVYFHGSSNRPDRGKWIVTHMAVIEAGDTVRATWPNALPVTEELLAYVGKPYPHGATEAPVPRDVDVLHHGVGHLVDLLARNSGFVAAIDGTPSGRHWRRELGRRAAELAQMYRTDWETLERIPA